MAESNTRVDEVADGLFRISTAADAVPGGFTFNQYLLVDDAPLLFHTGMASLFAAVCGAIATVMPVERLRFVSFCHFEADECGALNQFLQAAPECQPLCGQVGAMTSVGETSLRPPRVLADGESMSLGRHRVSWIDAPHVPHGWDNGFLFEETRRILFCGDLFTQAGASPAPVSDDILESSEAMRAGMDYFAHGPNTRSTLERLAALQPQTLACMHGSAFNGDGKGALLGLADRLTS